MLKDSITKDFRFLDKEFRLKETLFYIDRKGNVEFCDEKFFTNGKKCIIMY